MRLSVDLSQNDVDRSDTRDHVGNQLAGDQFRQGLQIYIRWRMKMRAQRLWRAVAGYKTAQFAARRLHGHKSLARRRRKPFRKNFEVIDERFHLRLHFFACWRHDAWCIRPDRAFVGYLGHRLPRDIQALPHLRHAYHVARETVGIRTRRNVKFELFIARIGKHFPVVVGDARRAKRGAGHAESHRVFRRNITNALGAAHPDAVSREQRFVFVDAARHHLQKAIDRRPPTRRGFQSDATDADVTRHHALPGEHLENLQDLLALAEAIEKNGHGSEVDGVRSEPYQVRRNALQLHE